MFAIFAGYRIDMSVPIIWSTWSINLMQSLHSRQSPGIADSTGFLTGPQAIGHQSVEVKAIKFWGRPMSIAEKIGLLRGPTLFGALPLSWAEKRSFNYRNEEAWPRSYPSSTRAPRDKHVSAGNRTRVAGEHSSKELFEQLLLLLCSPELYSTVI